MRINIDERKREQQFRREEHVAKHYELAKLGKEINILQHDLHRKREEHLTDLRRQRGYSNPSSRMLEGETFIMPESEDWLNILQ